MKSMDASPNKGITPLEWGQILDKYVDSRKKLLSQGHLHVYITPDMQYKLFSKTEAGVHSGLTKIPLKRIIELTLPMLRCHEGRALLEHLETLGALLAAKQTKQIRDGGQSAISLVQKKTFPRQIAPVQNLPEVVLGVRGHNLVSPERLRELRDCLAANPQVSRSGDGRDGVFYLEHPEHPKVVVKFCSDVHRHILADRLLGKFFQVPVYESLSSDMKEAQATVALVSDKGRGFLQEHLDAAKKKSETEHTNQDAVITTFSMRLNGLNWILDQGLVIAKFMDATAFKDMLASDRAELLSYKKFVFQLGEMMLIDTVLHNTDRVSESICNKANFMVTDDKELVCIDHDFNITRDNLPLIRDNLTNLLGKDNGLQVRADHLLNEGGKRLACNKDQLIADLRHGVESAAQKLVDILKTEPTLLDIPEKEGCVSCDPHVMNELVEHLSMLSQKGGNL